MHNYKYNSRIRYNYMYELFFNFLHTAHLNVSEQVSMESHLLVLIAQHYVG